MSTKTPLLFCLLVKKKEEGKRDKEKIRKSKRMGVLFNLGDFSHNLDKIFAASNESSQIG